LILNQEFITVSAIMLNSNNSIQTDWDNLTELGGFCVAVDPGKKYQTLKGFAASDAWSCKHVGEHWEKEKKEQIADWLFSRDFDNEGNPKGIGLSQWRVNFGAGSCEQGYAGMIGVSNNPDDSNPNPVSSWPQRAECFLADIGNPKGAKTNPLNPDAELYTHPASGMVYDFSKAQGQQYFFRKAKEMGVEKLIGFSNSPLVCWTKNGWATNAHENSVAGEKYTSRGKTANLKKAHYSDFAAYLADVADYWASQGFRFDYISPVNEPQWEWDGEGQEGSPWLNSEIAEITKELDKAIQDPKRANINTDNTKIMIAESGAWGHAYGGTDEFSNQIAAFFDPANTTTYVGGLPSMQPKIFAGHSYWSHPDDTALLDSRIELKKISAALGVDSWNTEWSALQGGTGLDFENFTYFDTALFMAKLIFVDLTVGNVGSWAYWTALGTEMWGHKDRFTLIGLYPGADFADLASPHNHPLTKTGHIKSQPTLWALGNYSLFIRPGYTRIDISNAEDGGALDDVNGLMASAYISDDNSRIVAVFVNYKDNSCRLAAKFTDGRLPGNIRCYCTDARNTNKSTDDGGGSGLRREDHHFGQIIVPARSVYTVVYDFD